MHRVSISFVCLPSYAAAFAPSLILPTTSPHICLAMDRQSVYTLSVFPEDRDSTAEDSPSLVQEQLVNFILDFHVDNVFLYRDQIRQNVLSKRYFCDVDIGHLIAYDEQLAHRLNNEPGEIVPIVCTLLLFSPSYHFHTYPSSHGRSPPPYLPLVSASLIHNSYLLPMLHDLIPATVRGCHQAMYTEDRLPFTAKCLFASPPITSTLVHHPNTHSWLDCHPRLSPRPHSWYRHWRQHSLLKSHHSTHSVSKLPAFTKHSCHWWLHWRHPTAYLRSHCPAWRGICQVPP